MKIEILGSGCAKCKQLHKNVLEVVKDSAGVDVIKVEDMQKIVGYGVMATPALVVDGQVAFAGRIATLDELKKLLNIKGE